MRAIAAGILYILNLPNEIYIPQDLASKAIVLPGVFPALRKNSLKIA